MAQAQQNSGQGKNGTFEIPALIGGLDTASPPADIQDNELSSVLNAVIFKNRITNDTGYTKFAALPYGAPSGCYSQAVYQFFLTTGVSILLNVTMRFLFTYNATLKEWEPTPTGSAATGSLTAPAAAGTTSLTVANSSSFTVGDYYYLELADGHKMMFKVTALPDGTTLTIDTPIKSGATAASGADINQIMELHGTVDNQIAIVTHAGKNWCTFTNNVDNPLYFDGSFLNKIPGLPNSGDVVCGSMEVWNDSLFLMDMVEGGTAYPQRIRWCAIGDPTDWTTGVGKTAGYTDLNDTEDNILAAGVLGPYLIVYKERTIIEGTYYGTDDIQYSWQTMVSGEGLLSQGTLVNMGDYHVFFGNSNTYSYNGGYSITPFTDTTFYQVFSIHGGLNPSKRYLSFAFYVEELDEIWFFYPSGSSEVCDTLLRITSSNNNLMLRRFNDAIGGYGFYLADSSRTWADAIGAWRDQEGAWNSIIQLAESPTTILGAAQQDGIVFSYDYVTPEDDGTIIAYDFRTKDFQVPNWFLRFYMVELRIQASNMLVSYSTDGGVSWEPFGTVSNGTEERVRFYRSFIFQSIMLRFSGDGSFNLGKVNIDYSLESEW